MESFFFFLISGFSSSTVKLKFGFTAKIFTPQFEIKITTHNKIQILLPIKFYINTLKIIIYTDYQSKCRIYSLYPNCSFDFISAINIVKIKKPNVAFLISIDIKG